MFGLHLVYQLKKNKIKAMRNFKILVILIGLGFFSSWKNYFPLVVTPEIIGITNEPANPSDTIVFGGFQETAFDKYLILLPENNKTSSYTVELNKFANGPGSTFESIDDFSNQFMASPQYLVAKKMYNYTVNPKDMIFKPSVSDKEDDVTFFSMNTLVSRNCDTRYLSCGAIF